MINKQIATLINEQVNKELYSAYLYLDFANYFEDCGLDTLIKIKYQKLKEQKKQDATIKVDDPDFIDTANIYRYDYMMMDALYDSLKDLNYKIVYLKEE